MKLALWEFKHTDCDGVTHVTSFKANRWPDVLPNFINFLRGSGYDVSSESLEINRDKHPFVVFDDTSY